MTCSPPLYSWHYVFCLWVSHFHPNLSQSNRCCEPQTLDSNYSLLWVCEVCEVCQHAWVADRDWPGALKRNISEQYSLQGFTQLTLNKTILLISLWIFLLHQSFENDSVLHFNLMFWHQQRRERKFSHQHGMTRRAVGPPLHLFS